MHTAVWINAIDAEDGLFDRLVAEVTRVGEINASIPIDDEIVGRIEVLSSIQACENMTSTGLKIGSNDGPTTEVRAARDHHAARGVELNPRGHPARRTNESSRTVGRVVGPNIAGSHV
jgi:hypothetical protein